jgi:folate/biopterin transporter
VVGKVAVTPARARITSLGRRATTLPSPVRPRRSAFHVVSQRTARMPRRRPPGKTSRPLAAPRERGSLEVEVESSEAALPTARADKGDGLAGISLAGVPLTPEVSAIVLVYFVQGILGLSRLAKDYFVKDELGLSPAEASIIFTISSVPWLVKPLWGFISDSVPLAGYKRKSYLAACGFLGAGAGFSLCTVVNDVPGAVLAFTLGSLSTAFSDVVIDSIVVARARGESQALSGSLQSLCWGSVAIGGIASSYFSGSLIETYGTKYVFGVSALFPLLIACAALLVREDPVDEKKGALKVETADAEARDGEKVGDQLVELGKKLWAVGKQRRIWAPTAFVFLWQATPNPGTAMFYFTTNELGFTPEFLGRVALARSVAALVGVGVYNGYLKKVPLKKMFFWSAVVGTALGLTQLMLVTGYNREIGISDQFFSLGDTVVLTVLGEVSFLPVLVLAAKICPEGVEATLFAALMSVFNAGGAASGALGAALTSYLGVTAEDFTNLFWLVLICNLSSLMPLAGLRWLDEADKEWESEEDAVAALKEGGSD